LSFRFENITIDFSVGDSIALALLRAGFHPSGGGCLCLAGDCPHCLATVDGIPYVRSCRVTARSGMEVTAQAPGASPPLPVTAVPIPPASRRRCDVVVIGQGRSGKAAAESARALGRQVITIDSAQGQEAVGIYAGPLVVVRSPDGLEEIHAHEVVIATGALEEQPVCPGNELAGIVTTRAASQLAAAGVDLGQVVAVGRAPDGVSATAVEGRPVRFEGTTRVAAVVVRGPDGRESRHRADTVVVGLGLFPRDVLARMGPGSNVTTVGAAAATTAMADLPPSPESGVVCPCSAVEVSDLESVWERGFTEMELLKRATLAGTGACQGAVCLPHMLAFLAARADAVAAPFTARPVARPITMAEAAAGAYLTAVRRTALHDEHLEAGALMDRFGGWWRPWHYGDPDAEYRAVRTAVSVGDVGTLGKILVSGPDAVELLERVYPTHIDDLRPGRSRYVLLLNERGHVIDDGMVFRQTDTRFLLTFTSAGAGYAEMWLRDWAETFDLDVHILDRTVSWGAINVTGPLADQLLSRAGLDSPPRYLAHGEHAVAGVPCKIFRLSFTGEISFELHHQADRSVELWRALLRLGADLSIRPHGLKALFALRLDKGHVIVGMDTEFDSTPRRLGMEWAVKMDKADFIGRHSLTRTNRLPLDKKLVGLTMEGEPAEEGAILTLDGRFNGYVTSSNWSSALDGAVMLGWIRPVAGTWPDRLECAGRIATVAPIPFYDPEGRRARA
jgi:glycine cleavage system aminomethyltransferase T